MVCQRLMDIPSCSSPSLMAFNLRDFLNSNCTNPSQTVGRARIPAMEDLVRVRFNVTHTCLVSIDGSAQSKHYPHDVFGDTQDPHVYQQHASHPPNEHPPVDSKEEEMVWVDAFFYGFYLEKSKVEAYKAGEMATRR